MLEGWCEAIVKYFLGKKDVDLVDEVGELLRLLAVMVDMGRVLWVKGNDGRHHFVITSSNAYVKQLGKVVGGLLSVGDGRLHITVFVMIKGNGIKAVDVHVECDGDVCLIEYDNEILGDVSLSTKIKEEELEQKLTEVIKR